MQQNQGQGMSGDRGRTDETRRDQDRMKSEGGSQPSGANAQRPVGTADATGGKTPGRDTESRAKGAPGQSGQSGQGQGQGQGQMVGQQSARGVQPFIKNVDFPANKDEILRGARDANAPAAVIDLIVLLDDDTDYQSDDEVVVAIAQCTI